MLGGMYPFPVVAGGVCLLPFSLVRLGIEVFGRPRNGRLPPAVLIVHEPHGVAHRWNLGDCARDIFGRLWALFIQTKTASPIHL